MRARRPATACAYRVEEMNSAANRGVHGVSDVAASAIWALDAMFNASRSGATGVDTSTTPRC